MGKQKKTKYTVEEEFSAIVRYKILEDEQSLAVIVEQYKDLVHRIAHNFYKNSNRSRVQFADLVSDGYAGLIHAVKKHSVVRCDKMYITANFYITEAIKKTIMDSMSVTRNLSTNSNGRKLFHGYGKTLRELGVHSPLSDDEVTKVANKLQLPEREIRFMETVYATSDAVPDSVLEWTSDQSHEVLEAGIDEIKILKMLREQYASSFDEREQDIIASRILTDEPVPAKDMAAKYGISQSAIYQLEKKISNRLIAMVRDDFNINIAA